MDLYNADRKQVHSAMHIVYGLFIVCKNNVRTATMTFCKKVSLSKTHPSTCFKNVIVLAWYTMRQRCLIEPFHQFEKQFPDEDYQSVIETSQTGEKFN